MLNKVNQLNELHVSMYTHYSLTHYPLPNHAPQYTKDNPVHWPSLRSLFSRMLCHVSNARASLLMLASPDPTSNLNSAWPSFIPKARKSPRPSSASPLYRTSPAQSKHSIPQHCTSTQYQSSITCICPNNCLHINLHVDDYYIITTTALCVLSQSYITSVH